jgi:FKBP12-rapamycin complex-associated protein
MMREKFPEKIPFRLTRMLVNAMEVSGIEGTFRMTAENVMRVLRDNKESLMAVLEAFVYDPLINWRLLATNKQMHDDDATRAAAATAAAQADVEVPTQRPGAPTSATAGVAAAASASGTNPITSNPLGGGVHGPDAPANAGDSEVLNAKAVAVIGRVESKLSGRDFDKTIVLDTSDQVEKLIRQATSHTNLCQCYIGWCPFW